MTRTTLMTTFGLLATVAAAAFAPVSALADSQQGNKNLWRNGAILGGVAALYGLHNHDTVTTVLGAAGAAYAANRYEQDRHSQDQAQRARQSRALYYRNNSRPYAAPYSGTRRYYHTATYSRLTGSSGSAGRRTRRVTHRRACRCPR